MITINKEVVKAQIDNPYNSDKATMVAILMTLEEILHILKEQGKEVAPAELAMKQDEDIVDAKEIEVPAEAKKRTRKKKEV